MKEYKNRNDVPAKYKMDLNDFFESQEEFNETYQKAQKEIKKLSQLKGNLTDSTKLEQFLDLYTNSASIVENLYVYAYVSHDLDLQNETFLEMKNKAELLYSEFDTAISFFEPEIVKMDENSFQALWNNKNLEKYRFLLEEIYKEKEHTLSDEAEEIINTLGETFSSYENISSSLINSEHNYGSVSLENGKKIEIASNNLRSLKRNPLESVRKTAHKKFCKTTRQYQNTESALLHYYVKNNCNLAKIKKFKSAWDAKLHHIHLPNEVFDNLKSVAKEQKTAWQDYYQLIKEILNKKTLYNYDTMVNWNSTNKEYTIEESEELIQNALSILGPDYQEKLKKVFDNHYIDYCSYKGKVSGGYSFATSTKNSRIVLSFNNQYSDILTIAHEAGHNVHHQYVNEANELWYRHTSSFVAEIASLTNEFLLNHYIGEHAKTKEEKLIGIEHTLKTFQTNFFGAIMEGEIEQKMYEHVESGNMITASFLNNLVKDSLKNYQGSSIKQDQYSDLMWVTRSHYYMNFYLYSYSLCVSIAASLAMRILKKEDSIIKKYTDFLHCGSNKYPEEVYQTLGINIREKQVFESAVEFFKEELNQYKTILKSGEVL